MARVRVTGYLDSEDMGRFHDPTHAMGVTDPAYERHSVMVEFADDQGPLMMTLDDVEFKAVE